MPQDQTQDSAEVTASWWAALHQLEERVDRRFAAGDERMSSMQADIAENTRLTKENAAVAKATNEKTTEIFEFLNTMKSLLKLGNMLSAVTIKVWKPLSFIAITVSAIVTAVMSWKGGK